MSAKTADPVVRIAEFRKYVAVRGLGLADGRALSVLALAGAKRSSPSFPNARIVRARRVA